MTVRRIATEEAFVTQDIADEWRRLKERGAIEPGFRKMCETMLGQSRGAREVHRQLVDIGVGRLAQMDATGIDMQLLSLCGYQQIVSYWQPMMS